MLVVAGYAVAAEIGLTGKVRTDVWVQPTLLLVLFLAFHVVIRFLAPFADPVFLPAVATLNGLGVVFLRRLDLGNAIKRGTSASPWEGDSIRQLGWTAAALVVASAALWIIKDHRALSRYAYTLCLGGIILVILPAVLPASLSEVNGAKLWIRFGGFFQIQPGEFAKLMLLVFFAYYLVRKREVLSLASRRFLGIDFPRGRDVGPVVLVWLMSLLVLVFEKDLGTSLLYFGMFIVTLYIATERVSWLLIGLVMFFGGAFTAYFLGAAFGGPFANFHERVGVWLNPFSDPRGNGYQLVQSLLGLGTGGLFGAGPGAGQPTQVPEVRNDFIFAGLGEEIGLFGLTALLVVYLMIVQRGLRSAIAVRDSFGKLLAGGLAFTLGLQVFVIVGGVSKLIPLTGQTTPFMSAGGSSLMANWLLIALLLRISDAARRPAAPPVATSGPARLAGLATEVI
ncbi:MAG TPA: FtsW/RodA/SpoVE family cell cycle protein [Micromonosporaceae bacterium]|nr:FtsW/RodA/SpoVE family cell cycle protein [Micromonosporaceae bacterium]